MSALGHKRTLKRLHPMSALPPKADIIQHDRDVRFVPKADIDLPTRSPRRRWRETTWDADTKHLGVFEVDGGLIFGGGPAPAARLVSHS